jgi:hypothetical protein
MAARGAGVRRSYDSARPHYEAFVGSCFAPPPTRRHASTHTHRTAQHSPEPEPSQRNGWRRRHVFLLSSSSSPSPFFPTFLLSLPKSIFNTRSFLWRIHFCFRSPLVCITAAQSLLPSQSTSTRRFTYRLGLHSTRNLEKNSAQSTASVAAPAIHSFALRIEYWMLSFRPEHS